MVETLPAFIFRSKELSSSTWGVICNSFLSRVINILQIHLNLIWCRAWSLDPLTLQLSSNISQLKVTNLWTKHTSIIRIACNWWIQTVTQWNYHHKSYLLVGSIKTSSKDVSCIIRDPTALQGLCYLKPIITDKLSNTVLDQPRNAKAPTAARSITCLDPE